MPSFTPPAGTYAPFGRNEYRFSTVGLKYRSKMVAKASVPFEDIDGTQQKILQSGEALATITEVGNPDKGKVGPFQLDATDGRQTLANLVGVNDTFTPWQLLKRDKEVAVCYTGSLVQSKCFIRDATGKRIPMPDNVAAALVAQKRISLDFPA